MTTSPTTPVTGEARHTPGPWAWFGNAGSNSVYLATERGGRRFVMDFVRWGFRGAQPRFQPGRGVMVEAKELLQFEVGDRFVVGIEQAKKDTSVYRLDVRGIDCADARLIAAAPELLAALKLVVTRCGPNSEDGKQARAAIAKAEGAASPIPTKENDDAR